ncbi:hypothetical protein JL721_4917 [Aureococcus anophagefferens]|nr:hypothetical protein JL721_4917 [Aureococcus anophagefferens]
MGFGSASPAEAAAPRGLAGRRRRQDLAAADADAAALFGAGDLDAGDARSGKTWRALDFLASRGDGCYAGPLRALAWEVRESMVQRVAEKWGKIAPGVGLWTGEESEDADASVLCCTAEVAPADGDVLVLDEVHWCVDGWRGHAWTRLLMAAKSGRYRHVRVCGPVEALPLLERVFEANVADGTFEVDRTARRSRLTFEGDVGDLTSFLRARVAERRFVAVVAFSRSSVLALAARRRPRAGARRGRGRGDAPGHCWVYGKFNAKAALVKKAVAVANGDGAPVRRPAVGRAVLSPDLGALVDVCGGEASILHLPNAIALWREELARDFEADDSAFPTWVKGGDFADLTARLRKLASPELVPRDVRRALKLGDLWHLARLPIGERNFDEIAEAACLLATARAPADFEVVDGEKLEDEVQRLGDLLIAARRFPGILPPGILAAARGSEDEEPYDDALEAAEALYLEGSKRVGTQVQRCIDNARKCVDCGRNKSANAKPSDARCRSCFLAKMRDEQEQRRASDAASMPATPSTPGRPVVLDLRRTPYTPMGTPIVLAPGTPIVGNRETSRPTAAGRRCRRRRPAAYPGRGGGRSRGGGGRGKRPRPPDVNARTRNRGKGGGKGKPENKPGQYF